MVNLDRDLLIIIFVLASLTIWQRIEYEDLVEEYVTFSRSIDTNCICDKIAQGTKTKVEK